MVFICCENVVVSFAKLVGIIKFDFRCRILLCDRFTEKKGAAIVDDSVGSEGNKAVVYDFDQVDRHRKFWEFLRNKEWQAVATFVDKKVCQFSL